MALIPMEYKEYVGGGAEEYAEKYISVNSVRLATNDSLVTTLTNGGSYYISPSDIGLSGKTILGFVLRAFTINNGSDVIWLNSYNCVSKGIAFVANKNANTNFTINGIVFYQ